jgi:hypothetical protein
MPKKTKAKKNTTVVRLRSSPAKEDQRYYAGSRTSSTGLCGALKRQAMCAVKWAREVADIQAASIVPSKRTAVYSSSV